MRFVFYTHSLVSDWNHGNAHFLRGVMRELIGRGHRAVALEPAGGWSRSNLIAEHGNVAEERFAHDFPDLRSISYGPGFDHAAMLDSADVVVVHEWSDPALVAEIGLLRRYGGRFALLFHDTHHRAVSDSGALGAMDLSNYDGVLAFGASLRARYVARGWGRRAFVWHEAADTRLFHPMPEVKVAGDLVWIGNWGDGERSAELREFLVEPVRRLELSPTVRGVRYPEEARALLHAAGITYGGWVPNADVPRLFAEHRVTIHVPRRPYVAALPGIPTIRVFEALACGIPLISAPWEDAENLFAPGEDFLIAADGEEMTTLMRDVLADRDLAAALAASGLARIRARHTCAHRVDELLAIVAGLRGEPAGADSTTAEVAR